jgi:hypothetical protein
VFGNLTQHLVPVAPAGQQDSVCGITETFTSGGDTIIANGFASGTPGAGTGNTNPSLKSVAVNGLAESGLGTNGNATPGVYGLTARSCRPLPSRLSPEVALKSPMQ